MHNSKAISHVRFWPGLPDVFCLIVVALLPLKEWMRLKYPVSFHTPSKIFRKATLQELLQMTIFVLRHVFELFSQPFDRFIRHALL